MDVPEISNALVGIIEILADSDDTSKYNEKNKLMKQCLICLKYFEAIYGLGVHQRKICSQPVIEEDSQDYSETELPGERL